MREERGLPRMTIRDIPITDTGWESLESQAGLPEELVRDTFFMRPGEWREARGDEDEDEGDSPPDVASTSSTSGPIFPSGAERD